MTGGGVTAGIDFALTLVSLLVDRPTAEMIQLRLEYNPAPPFTSGSPDTAPAEVIARLQQRNPAGREYRSAANRRRPRDLCEDGFVAPEILIRRIVLAQQLPLRIAITEISALALFYISSAPYLSAVHDPTSGAPPCH